MLPIRFGSAVLIASFAVIKTGTAQVAPDVERGRMIAQINCARCHSIDKVGPSPLSLAPPFRDLHNRYPVETLEESLAEGIVTGHPSMPEFRAGPDQVNDLVAFLKSLE